MIINIPEAEMEYTNDGPTHEARDVSVNVYLVMWLGHATSYK